MSQITTKYFDRLKRFGVNYIDNTVSNTPNLSQLIFPVEYKATFEDILGEHDLYGGAFDWRPYGRDFLHCGTKSFEYGYPESFLFIVWRRHKQKEIELGNVLYPPKLTINVDYVGGQKGLVELCVNKNEMLFTGVETVYFRTMANKLTGKTTEEIKQELLRGFEQILDDHLFCDHDGFGHKAAFEDKCYNA